MRIIRKFTLNCVLTVTSLLFLASCTGESDELKGMLFDNIFASCIKETMDDIGTDDPADIKKIECQRDVEGLNGIEMLANLEELHIQGNKLTDLNALGAIPTLHVLNVSASKTLITLDGISGAYNLQVLQASRVPRLRKYPPCQS